MITAAKYPAAKARNSKQAVLNLSDSKKSIILSVINFRAFVRQGNPAPLPKFGYVFSSTSFQKICSALLIAALPQVIALSVL